MCSSHITTSLPSAIFPEKICKYVQTESVHCVLYKASLRRWRHCAFEGDLWPISLVYFSSSCFLSFWAEMRRNIETDISVTQLFCVFYGQAKSNTTGWSGTNITIQCEYYYVLSRPEKCFSSVCNIVKLKTEHVWPDDLASESVRDTHST